MLTLPLVQEPYGDAPQLPDPLSPFCAQSESVGGDFSGDVAGGSGEGAGGNENRVAGCVPLRSLDVSGTALVRVPTLFFDRLGIPTVSHFAARALAPGTDGIGGFNSVGFDAFYSSTGEVPTIDFGVDSATSTTCETLALDGQLHLLSFLVGFRDFLDL
jgi:hypothetical protein